MNHISPLPLTLILLIYILRFTVSGYWKLSPHLHSFSGDETKKRGSNKLLKNFIGENRRICVCSGKDLFSFESNGTIAWSVHLNYTCNADIAPVHGGSSKIYVVAENKVLKIYPLNIGTSEAAVRVFFDPELGEGKPGEIVGVSASVSSSVVLINAKNHGLFAYKMHGQLLWIADPVLYRNGYCQGCRKNTTECWFTSPPVIDHCEVYNNVGELYSLSLRHLHFNWIQDLRMYGNSFIITAGNNGRLYVTIPDLDVVLALSSLTGNILWQGSVGPLSSSDYEPVVDANGWISFGSLDGFLYSFSPTGSLRKFKSTSSSSVIQMNPVLDCSGYGIYISEKQMEDNKSHTNADYHNIYALKPKSVVFTHLIPASGEIHHHSERDPGKILFKLSQSDLQHFIVGETTLLAFFAASSNKTSFPCRTSRQKLASSCSQVKLKSINLYTGDKKTITLFLVIESILVVILAAAVGYCCIFWRKRKLQGLGLVKFLDKRRSLRLEMKEFDRMIVELERETSKETEPSNDFLGKLSDLIKQRDCIRRKLSSCYSLGRDGETSGPKSMLPLYNSETRSYSFQGLNKESLTIFHSLSDTCSGSEGYTSTMEEAYDARDEIRDDVKGKAPMIDEDSSGDNEMTTSPSGSGGSSGSCYGDSPGYRTRSFRRTALPFH